MDGWIDGRTDGWNNCWFTFFSAVFQSCQTGRRVIMNAVCNGIPITAGTIAGTIRSKPALKQMYV